MWHAQVIYTTFSNGVVFTLTCKVQINFLVILALQRYKNVHYYIVHAISVMIYFSENLVPSMEESQEKSILQRRQFLYTRCQNTNKKRASEITSVSQCKRSRVESADKHAYAVLDG